MNQPLRTIDLRFALPDFEPTFEVTAIQTRTTFGGVRHFEVGFGYDGQLLAVESGVEYRGAFTLGRHLHGDEVFPEIRAEATRQLGAIFDAEWRR